MEDYIKYIVDKYDLSFSEVIRGEICIAILCAVSNLYPDLKLDITTEEIFKMVEKDIQKGLEKEEQYRVLSKIYHEIRIAVEHRFKKEKQKKKK
jgi:hypothetical protein